MGDCDVDFISAWRFIWCLDLLRFKKTWLQPELGVALGFGQYCALLGRGAGLFLAWSETSEFTETGRSGGFGYVGYSGESRRCE